MFLQTLTSGFDATSLEALDPQLQTMIAGVMGVMMLLIAVVYVYFAWAFMSIGKKAGLKSPGVSWMNPIITLFEASKSHWWPLPVLVLGIFVSMALMLPVPALGALLYFAVIVFAAVMVIIWQWKTFRAVKRPGWWAVLPVIIGALGILTIMASPIFGLLLILASVLVYAILVGVAAWSKK